MLATETHTMINPFVVKDVPVVNQSIRPHLHQDMHGITSPSRLNLTTPSYTPDYVKSSEEVNHQAKEVK